MKLVNGELAPRYDVVVLGSGASGLAAAAVAARKGKKVLVLEKASLLGGTSAVSGGMIWVPATTHAAAAGNPDTLDEAATYVRAVARGRGREELLDAAVHYGPETLTFLEEECGMRFIFLDDFPDYRQDLPGASAGGRTLEPELFDGTVLGDLIDHVRTDGRAPFTMQEYERWGAFTKFPWDELAERQKKGLLAKGRALVAGLLASCVRDGVDVAIEARALTLRTSDNGVDGVILEDGTAVTADNVVVATGGFEWDKKLADSMVQSRIYTQCSPPSNTGDGLRMAQRIGSMTRGTREAWWAPMSVIPGDLRDGEQIGSLLRFERQGPGSLMVNRNGVRFANESQNYNDLARALHSWDSPNNRTLNSPVHVVFDTTYLKQYGVFAHRYGQPTPEYLIEAPTLAELAAKIHVPAEALEATVARFNGFAEQGVDSDFGRGESAYDKYWGDQDNPWPNPSLAPLTEGPFYALPVVNGVFGTNGGIATDGEGRVLDVDGQAIAGLYAVGNVTESAYAAGYPGAGATLGPILVFGYRIGQAIAA
ncbi:FAD-dependent oxidoreductase [Microbacterium sp. NPDC096154]|uniref:FAD-dependent oxidoreductase n=1 Tax=Microbacterium sp. NPDC096154 TaxID=3155549 RepID=UPI00332126D4